MTPLRAGIYSRGKIGTSASRKSILTMAARCPIDRFLLRFAEEILG